MPSAPGRVGPRPGAAPGPVAPRPRRNVRQPGALAGSYGQELRPGPSGKIAPAAYDGAERRATAPRAQLATGARGGGPARARG